MLAGSWSTRVRLACLFVSDATKAEVARHPQHSVRVSLTVLLALVGWRGSHVLPF